MEEKKLIRSSIFETDIVVTNDSFTHTADISRSLNSDECMELVKHVIDIKENFQSNELEMSVISQHLSKCRSKIGYKIEPKTPKTLTIIPKLECSLESYSLDTNGTADDAFLNDLPHYAYPQLIWLFKDNDENYSFANLDYGFFDLLYSKLLHKESHSGWLPDHYCVDVYENKIFRNDLWFRRKITIPKLRDWFVTYPQLQQKIDGRKNFEDLKLVNFTQAKFIDLV